MGYSLEWVTPEQARMWLDGSPQRVNSRKIEKYRVKMIEGRWEVTTKSHPMTFYQKERLTLKNGHHRCHAICRAQIPIQLWIYTGD